jgi:hypothetical protein
VLKKPIYIFYFKKLQHFIRVVFAHSVSDPDPVDQKSMRIRIHSTVVPEGADGHVGALRYEDHLPCRGPPHHSPVDRPQAGQDPEQGGLPASVRTGYEHMLTRLHLLADA